MPRITLLELRRRTDHQLLSDLHQYCRVGNQLITVRAAEREGEKRYPLHGEIRRAAIRHFEGLGWEVYPHGIGVIGAVSVMADLAIARGPRIIFVECLTPWRVTFENAQHKRRLEPFFPLWFVVEKPSADHPRDYEPRVLRLSRRNRVFAWSAERDRVNSFRGSPRNKELPR